MTHPETILEVEGVSVRFGPVQALDDVGLRVGRGERVALLGHNGAGKSTLFKSILGFLEPQRGRIAIAGAAPGSTTARRSVSYLPETVAFPRALSGEEIISYFARLKGEPPANARPLLESVGLGEAARRKVGTYSKGMRQRLGLAQALIGRPALMLLDEPTSGLDPLSRLEFYDIMARVAGEGTAVLLSSHALTEVEAKTDRVAILTKGRLAADAPLRELSRRAGLPIRVRVEARADAVDAVQARLGGERYNGRSVVLSCLADEKVDLLRRVTELDGLVEDIEVTLPDLNDVYRHFSKTPTQGPVQ